jgi:hypothetical protein
MRKTTLAAWRTRSLVLPYQNRGSTSSVTRLALARICSRLAVNLPRRVHNNYQTPAWAQAYRMSQAYLYQRTPLCFAGGSRSIIMVKCCGG